MKRLGGSVRTGGSSPIEWAEYLPNVVGRSGLRKGENQVGRSKLFGDTWNEASQIANSDIRAPPQCQSESEEPAGTARAFCGAGRMAFVPPIARATAFERAVLKSSERISRPSWKSSSSDNPNRER
jgi:hypothetical protein